MQPLSKKSIVLPFLIGLYLMVLVFFVAVLKYDFLRSDVLGYWRESLTWTMPFHEHPPLYAWMIALVRTLTLNFFPPAAVMIAINLLAFGCCIFLVMEFFHNAGVGPGYAALAALLFGLWPFVGLTYTVVPVADIPAIALTLAGLVLLQRSRYAWASLFFGLAIITHKGVWPVIGLVVLADFYWRREYLSKRNLIFLGIMLLPLTLLWAAGASYHHSANWLMERSMRVNTSMGGGYLVLDGLLGTFEQGGLKGIVKGSIVLFFLGLAAATLISSFYLKFRHYELGAALAAAVLIMFLFSSAAAVWGPVRFSKFLVIPLIFGAASYFGEVKAGRAAYSLGFLLLLGFLLTQFAYAWYIAAVFYA